MSTFGTYFVADPAGPEDNVRFDGVLVASRSNRGWVVLMAGGGSTEHVYRAIHRAIWTLPDDAHGQDLACEANRHLAASYDETRRGAS